MISAILTGWQWLQSKYLAVCIWIGVTAMLVWQIYVAGARKQLLDQLTKEKSDAVKRNTISQDIDAYPADDVRDKLLDRWSKR